MKKRGLGRSLNAILSPMMGVNEKNEEEKVLDIGKTPEGELQTVLLTHLVRGKYQPRREMDEEAIHELALSIKAQGLLQPIIVRPKGKKFEIIAGERRWRAAQEAGLKSIPVIIKEISDEASMAIGLIENIQRENLNAMDEALGLQRLLTEFSLTHQEIADAVGRSRTAVSNLLRLTHLPEIIQKYVQHGDLEMGHARALLSLSELKQIPVAEYVVQKGLSVRETEQYIKQIQRLDEMKEEKGNAFSKPMELVDIEKQWASSLGVKVSIKQNSKGKGKIIVHYASLDDLINLSKRIV